MRLFWRPWGEWVSCSFGDGYGTALLEKAAQNNNEGLFASGTHHLRDNAIKRNRLIKNKKVSNEPIISLRNVEQVTIAMKSGE